MRGDIKLLDAKLLNNLIADQKYINQWQNWSIIIALIQVKYLLTSFRQPNYRAIDSVNCMKSSDHTNDDKANCKYETISFYVFTLPNASNY